MDEYNINNIQKINSINFINISEDKMPSRSQKPFYKLKHMEYLNPINNLENSYTLQKGKYSQRNLSKKTPLNKKYIIGTDNIQNSPYSKPDIVFNDLNDNNLPVSSVSLYKPQKNLSVQQKYQTNRLNYSHQKINPSLDNIYNNNFNISNNYLNNFNNNTFSNNSSSDYPKNEELNQRNNNMLYENKINEYKKQSKILLNKLNFYIKDSKFKSKEIFDLQQKNKNLQNELNKYNVNRQIINEKNINNNNNDSNLQAITYKSKIMNKNFQNINKNNYRTNNNKLETSQEIKNIKQKNILLNSKELYNADKKKKSNVKMQKNTSNNEDNNLKQYLEVKENEIKLLYQKMQKMKKDIELLTLKNSKLSKMLTKKNFDLIGYQKNEIDREKKIEQLTSLLSQQSFNNKSLPNNNNYFNNLDSNDKNLNEDIEEINLLKNEIKSKNTKIKELNEENDEKDKQINELVKKLNDLEIDLKGTKSTERQYFFEIKKYRNDLLIKDEEIKKLTKKIKLYEEEKNDLTNNINNKEKVFNMNKNIISELKNELENNKKIIEQKDLENKKLINNNEELLIEIKNSKKNNNQNKEDDILLKRIQELSLENNKLLDQINTVNLKCQGRKKLLSEKNKEIENMKNEEKNNLDPATSTIIANKHYKKLVWYLLYKKPNNDKTENDENNYKNYFWVSSSTLKNEDLKKFNKFEDDNDKNNEMQELVIDLHKKLEQKEENISKLDYQNKKLAKELLNKTANLKGNIVLNKNSKEIFSNSFNNNKTLENEIKYKNILEKLNHSSQREKHLNNQITLLKEKLNEKNNLETNFPHDMRNIDPHLHDSGFLDDDSEDNKNIDIDNLISGEVFSNKNNQENDTNTNEIKNNEINNNEINDENNVKIEKMDMNDNEELYKSNKTPSKEDPFKESERKVDEFLMKGAGDEDDYDEVKIITKQMNFLKDEIKDYREKNKNLSSEIKDLFLKIKCNDKNRKNIVQICQLLGFQPQLVDQIISNKKPKK